MKVHVTKTARLGIAVFLLAATGCAGPFALRQTRQRYNEVIQRTAKEELLLNLVRLRYRDIPTFLELQSLATQFEFAKGASINGTLIESQPNILGLGATVGMADRPTISYSQLQRQEFVKQLISPMNEETIVLLTQSGWNISRVFQMAVQEMNGVLNTPRSSGPTPNDAPEFETFNYTVDILQQLQRKNAVNLGFANEKSVVMKQVPEGAVKGSNLVDAAQKGFVFEKTLAGDFQLEGKKKVLYLAPRIKSIDDARLWVMLKSQLPDMKKEMHKKEKKDRIKLTIKPRSLVGVMYYLSHVIDVPPEHYAQGLVPVTMYPWGEPFDWTRVAGNIFRVHVRCKRPKCAYVAVRYRGYWFYIPDDHLSSKATFTLLAGLVELQAGGGAVRAAPVLTLPVGR